MPANPVRGMMSPWTQGPAYQMRGAPIQPWQQPGYMTGRNQFGQMMSTAPAGWAAENARNQALQMARGQQPTVMPGQYQTSQFGGDETTAGEQLSPEEWAQIRAMGNPGLPRAGGPMNPSFAARKAAYANMSPQAPNLAAYANPALAGDPALQARRAYSAQQVATDPARAQRAAQAQTLQNALRARLGR